MARETSEGHENWITNEDQRFDLCWNHLVHSAMREVGPRDKTYFSCEKCPYLTKWKGHRNRHMRIHTGERPFSCDKCEYTAARSSTLAEHLRIHTGEKPFSCDKCQYSSRTSSNLISHMRTHTGEKPFSCNRCSYVARQRSHLFRHMETHMVKNTKQVEAKPWE